MHILHDEFLIAILLVQVVIFIGTVLGRLWAGAGWSLFMNIQPKTFPELVGFSPDDQDRLFGEACRRASQTWRWLVPASVFVVSLPFILGLAKAVAAKFGLASVGFFLVFVPIGGMTAWCFNAAVRRLSIWGARPFLHRAIEWSSCGEDLTQSGNLHWRC